MYTHNEIGPWPVLDIAQTRNEITTEAEVSQLFGAALTVRLDTPNLGTQDKAFINNSFRGTVGSLGYNRCMAFGVCLKPLESNSPIYIDYAMEVTVDGSNGCVATPFIGYIDTAGATISNGFGANNIVTNYCNVPCGQTSVHTSGISKAAQLLLQNITSAELDTEKFICMGFTVGGYAGAGFNYRNIDYTISARYATKSINTIGRGV